MALPRVEGHGPQGLDGIHAKEHLPLTACRAETLEIRQESAGELDGGKGEGPDLGIFEGGKELVFLWQAPFVGGNDAEADPPPLFETMTTALMSGFCRACCIMSV